MSAAPDRLKIAMAQISPVMGDIAGNRRLIEAARVRAAEAGVDLVVFPELCVVGYPPEDLVLRLSVQEACEAAVQALAALTADGGPALLVGSPWREGGKLYNAALLLDGGAIAATRFKHELPNYGVFDEKRVFSAGPLPGPVPFRGVRLGVMVCEDMWLPDVAECLAETGAEMLIVPNGSPFEAGKWDTRLNLGVARVVETGLPLLYVNYIGGQDELVFDGGGFVLNADRRMVVRQPDFVEHLQITDWRRGNDGWHCEVGPVAEPLDRLSAIYQAMVVGLRDYVTRNRFPGVVLGLSGGIDSALSAAVAVDALGADKVHCVMMPSRYTSQQSLDDAASCAAALGIKYDTIPIEPAVQAFAGMLAPIFAGRAANATEENIQARVRGVTVMAISNKFGHMVLTTGNKSEMSVGYATLYGDMCGGYSVLKDVYKMTVFALSRWRNAHVPAGGLGPAGEVIPDSIIVRPPTAELRENQLDQDSLPPYGQLDAILEMLIEKEMPVRDIVATGQPEAVVRRIQHMLYVAEYKRRQAPPGVKITARNFGRDRRYPITNAFRDLSK
ncbi:NAD+ synthase [Ferrovibrio sp.]|uniref:NAD+ synthase n=1 Tax=Ferrovibrio sp. TaxID=1917215 RepID=UPI002609ED18|nr:NAD+ synthase [Ferrovibrio sp.]